MVLQNSAFEHDDPPKNYGPVPALAPDDRGRITVILGAFMALRSRFRFYALPLGTIVC